MSTISKKQFKQYIEEFDFTGLFNQLGWTYLDEQSPVKLKEETFLFHSVAEKGGFRILVFKPSKHQDLPDYATRLQVDRKIGKLFREHLIIFCDKNNSTQIWQLFVKQLGKPSRLSETRWHKGQEPELLYQKTSNLFFTLDQEENITIADVVDVVNENFSKNVEQVTKKFYENFRKEHKKFIDFIKGISVVADREWYASLMLNRLMFCYFIQKKGFLDSNLNYLKDKLTYSQNKKGKDKFYVSFYKNFLIALFHQGLGSPDQSEELKKEIGKIPYLNGGLFDVHELEKQYKDIDISDKAFENIFHFFDEWKWHLDTNITASGKDINPDVIGFIFEKYINDRAQMGAYYTKEDITDYISKNCIIPFLFDETERTLRQAQGTVKAESKFTEVWQMLKESGDTYIYEAVKKGVDIPLPEEIEIGIDSSKPNLIERRKDWNKPASAECALPTEIWREVVDRRKRYTEIKEKIDKGEITQINDFITHNLNIRQFTQDIIDSHGDPDFVRHFYESLSNITIIDPTCGSGAFLFAAMNILEPLYESCIQRMENFVEEAPKGKHARFEEILKYVKAPEHPNLKYFVFKNIILRNLYGVDIMKEAVEIAKLRLFLKLVATVDADYKKPNLGLEPLPDIDFNIRSGNTLIGYATKTEIDDLQGMFVTPIMKEQILEECDLVSRAFQRFKEIQLKGYENKKEFTKAKTELNSRLDKLAGNLNKILYKQHYESMDYEKWLKTHQPFHWFAEFYEIVQNYGGFNIVIGNPPYVEYGTKLKAIYTLKDYQTLACGNLHAFVTERSLKLVNDKSYIGLIVPLPSMNTSRMVTLQNILKPKPNHSGRNIWISAYDERPSSLFDGVDQRLIIEVIGKKVDNCSLHTTGIQRWFASTRDYLFPCINYSKQSNKNLSYSSSILKIQDDYIETEILRKFYSNKPISYFKSEQPTRDVIYYRTAGGRYWKVISNKPSGTKTVSEKAAYFRNLSSQQAVSIFSSSTFWWYYSCHYDMFNLKDYMIFGFRFSDASSEILNQLNKLGREYLESLEENSEIKIINSKTQGTVKQKQFVVSKSKSIIDEIDTVLAQHFKFNSNELEFIMNYDIKNRMGKELENGEEE